MFCRVAPDDFWARLGTANDRAVIRLNVEPGRKQGEFNHGKLGIYRRKAGRFSPFGSNPTELVADRERSRTASAWLGVGGVPSPREACAANPSISGVRAPRPQNPPDGFDPNASGLAPGFLLAAPEGSTTKRDEIFHKMAPSLRSEWQAEFENTPQTTVAHGSIARTVGVKKKGRDGEINKDGHGSFGLM